MPLPSFPILVNHMAALDHSPEGQSAPPNSLESIRACLEDQAAFIEVDITALADSDYLLVHDEHLEAETTGHGEVAACSASDARGLSIQQAGVPMPYRVPLLSDVVALLMSFPGAARLQLDFKNMLPFTSEEPLQRLIDLIEPLGNRVIVSTGADWQLRKLRRLAPWLELGLDIHFYIDWREPGQYVDPRMYPKQLGAYGYWDDHPIAAHRFWSTAEYLTDRCGALIGLVSGVSTFYVSHRLLAQSLDDGFNWAEMLHSAGMKLDSWTLDIGKPIAEANARRLAAAGVDQITTNTPHQMAALLRSTSSA